MLYAMGGFLGYDADCLLKNVCKTLQAPAFTIQEITLVFTDKWTTIGRMAQMSRGEQQFMSKQLLII